MRAFGGAPALGDALVAADQTAVELVATVDGDGYWVATDTGTIHRFGTAGFYGSTGAMSLNQPVVGMAAGPL